MPLVEISLLPGRTAEQKTEIARKVFEALVSVAGATPGTVQVIFRETARTDWLRPSDLLTGSRQAGTTATGSKDPR